MKFTSTQSLAQKPVAHGAAVPSVDIDGVSLAVDHHEVGELPTESYAAQMAQIGDLENITMPDEAYFEVPLRYLVAFQSDFCASVDEAVAQAARNFDVDDLKTVVIVACTPLGRIEVRPVFISEAA